MKRFISTYASELKEMTSSELKQAILASDGRVLLGETVVTSTPLVSGVTNAEVMASFSADMLLLNEYDVFTQYICEFDMKDPIAELKRLTGRVIGINIEPVDVTAKLMENQIQLSKGRTVSEESLREANRQDIDFICLTGNPATGVSNASIEASIKLAREHYKGLIFAGKMHSAGVNEPVVSEESLLRFIELGADGVLIPTPGTAPGIDELMLKPIIEKLKSKGAIVMGTVGTSQESADVETIKHFALTNKRLGVDIHHLGDGSYGRLPEPENLLAMSIAMRGKRHTYFRMCQSVNR